MCRHIRNSTTFLVAVSLALVGCGEEDTATDTGDVWRAEDSSEIDDADATLRDLSDVECDREDGDCPGDPCENRDSTADICDGNDDDCDGTTDPMSADCGWTRMVGSDQIDTVADVATTADGNVYVVGGTQSSLNGQTYAGGRADGFVMQFTSSGNVAWTRLIGTTGQDLVGSVEASDDGSVYVAGSVAGDLHQRPNAGEIDALVTKFDASGSREWTRLIGTDGVDVGNGLVLDGDGNVYLAGRAPKSFDGRTYNGGAHDGFVVKFDHSGSRVWTRFLGTSTGDKVLSAAADERGGLYLVGITHATLHGRNYAGEGDGFVVKLDGTGARLWTRSIGTAGKDFARAVAVYGSGNVYVAGETSDELDGRSYNGGKSDAFIAQFDRSGSRNWTRLVGTSEFDTSWDVAYRRGSSVYLVGRVGESLNQQEFNGGVHDGFVVQFDRSGAETSTALIGTFGHDSINTVDLTDRNRVYLGGWTSHGLHGRPYNGGQRDGFLVRRD